MGRGCLCFKLMFFNRSSKSFMPIKKPRKACIRSCDTNNFTQSLIRKYHHTATESLYLLCDKTPTWTPTLAVSVLSVRLCSFPNCLQCKISGSSVSSIFPHEVSHHKVRKVTDSKFRWAWLGGLKSP